MRSSVQDADSVMSDPDPLAEVKARWFTDDQHRAEYWADLASRDVPLLVGEVERLQRYEAMWQDCRRHRDQAEQRARRLQEIVTQVAGLVAPDEDEL